MSTVTSLIEDGRLDSSLDRIIEAANLRRKILRDRETDKTLRDLKVGDIVFLSNLRPKYICKYRATITEVRASEKKVMVDLIGAPPFLGSRSRYSSKGLIIPASCVKKV